MEILKAIRLLGLPHLWRLRRGHRVVWEEMLRGHIATSAMQALLNIGFIDELMGKGSANVAAFAAAHNLDAHILDALCESCYSLRLLQKQGAAYTLDAKGRLIVDAVRGWIDVSYGYNEIFSSLEEMLRKQKIYGKDYYRRSDFVARGSGEMNSPIVFPLAVDLITRNGYGQVLDLGCGDGTFLRHLCRANPAVKAYGIDLAPAAIEDGKLLARKAGFEERLHLFVGDVCKLQEFTGRLAGLDAATIFFVLHEVLYHSEQLVIDFLQGFRAAFPGVPLVVFEAIRPSAADMRRKPGISIYYYLYHELSQQKTFGREQWRKLFDRAGCQVEERYLPYAKVAIFTLR